MSYLSDFDRSFSEHTLQLVQTYEGKFDATLMVNCLLGLLVVPKETVLKAIPESPLTDLPKWGISMGSIKSSGRPTKTNPRPETLRGLVANLRHSVAHFQIKPVPSKGDVHSFEFKNHGGLHAIISLSDMRQFVEHLADHLSRQ